jgi:hypothetical protein
MSASSFATQAREFELIDDGVNVTALAGDAGALIVRAIFIVSERR